MGNVGVPCLFPFTLSYAGMNLGTYEACAEYNGIYLCATELDNNDNAVGYGVCGPNCPGKEMDYL